MTADARTNHFGLLRLIFAASVIVSHAGPMIDGSRAREPLALLSGTIALSQAAVDGFFLISGFLIVRSWQQSPSPAHYLLRRVLRIYPGFVVAFLLSLLLVTPLGGGDLGAVDWPWQGLRLLVLMQPLPTGVFTGLPFPLVNGPMWTIAYEFRCYLLTAAMGACGLFRHRRVFLALTLGLLVFTAFARPIPDEGALLLGDPASLARFLGLFCAGGVFHLFAPAIRYTPARAAVAFALLCAAQPFPPLAEAAVATLGAYVLFWFALAVKPRWVVRFDLSYGLYLYAWPVASLILWHDRAISPLLLAGLTLPLAAALGAASWVLIERPCLSLSRPRR